MNLCTNQICDGKVRLNSLVPNPSATMNNSTRSLFSHRGSFFSTLLQASPITDCHFEEEEFSCSFLLGDLPLRTALLSSALDLPVALPAFLLRRSPFLCLTPTSCNVLPSLSLSSASFSRKSSSFLTSPFWYPLSSSELTSDPIFMKERLAFMSASWQIIFYFAERS